MLALYERAAAGDAEFCMVSGHSGIGKSALRQRDQPRDRPARRLLDPGQVRPVPEKQALFGRRERLPRARFATVWSNPRPGGKLCVRRLAAAVSPNLGLLVELVPELEQIVGPQPPVPPLPRTEAQNRFQIAFVNFVKVIASHKAVGDLPRRPAIRRRLDAEPDPVAGDEPRSQASVRGRRLSKQRGGRRTSPLRSR